MKNWAGNYSFAADTVHRPRSVEELAAIVAESHALRTVGSRHSFTAISDHDAVISLDELPRSVGVAADRKTASVQGAVTYAELGPILDRAGVALPTLASLPHITVAGAVATATHGSGVEHGNLSTAVRSMDIVTATGEVATVDSTSPDFAALAVGLGAFGVVVGVTLAVEPTYSVEQRVFESPSWATLISSFEEVMSCAHSVSVFTRWHEVDQVWLKQRADEAPIRSLLDATPATVHRHPILDHSAEACTPQLGIPGPWWDRLPHFSAQHKPSAGAEIQSEYHVRRGHDGDVIAAMRSAAEAIDDALLISEIRVVAADDLLLSPQNGQDTLSLHFTWGPDPGAAVRAAAVVEAALAPFSPRAHWGKLFVDSGCDSDRLARFADVSRRWDPEGVFTNSWLEEQLR